MILAVFIPEFGTRARPDQAAAAATREREIADPSGESARPLHAATAATILALVAPVGAKARPDHAALAGVI